MLIFTDSLESCPCDVIGCSNHAAWIHVHPQSGSGPDYLCHACFLDQRRVDPEYSKLYRPTEASEWNRSFEDAPSIAPRRRRRPPAGQGETSAPNP